MFTDYDWLKFQQFIDELSFARSRAQLSHIKQKKEKSKMFYGNQLHNIACL